MEKFLSEIVENHKSDRYTREIYQFEDIEITVLQNGDKIVVWGFNYKSQRFLNLGSKKYSILTPISTPTPSHRTRCAPSARPTTACPSRMTAGWTR